MSAVLPHLYFHRVSDHDSHYTCVTRRRFQDLLSCIGTLATATCVEAVADPDEVAAGDTSLMISFDDGYADLLEFAVPEMASAGVKATFFVVTDHMGQRAPWRQDASNAYLMGPSDLRMLVDCGFDVQIHGASHRRLTELPAQDVLTETVAAADRLADIVGRPVSCLAYPYGMFDARVISLVSHRFEAAFSTVRSPHVDWHQNRWALRRSYVADHLPASRIFQLLASYREGSDGCLLTH